MGLISIPSWGFWRVVALGILLPAVITDSADECTHYYLTQPPDALTCNPFHHLNQRMRLECSAYCSDQGEYEIVWFRLLRDEHNQTQQPQLLSREIRGVGIGMRGHRNNFTASQLTISNLQLQDVGLYWCQVVVPPTNDTPIKYFQPSIPVTLLPEESYASFPPCPLRVGLSQHKSQCAMEVTSDVAALPPSKPNAINPTVVSYSVHLCSTQLVSSTMENTPAIPYWAYSLIAVGVIILSVTVFLVVLLLCKRRKIQRDCVKASTRKTTSLNQTSTDIPNSFVSPYHEITGDAGISDTHSSLHSHIHVAPLNNESSEANEKKMQSASKDSTKMKKPRKPAPPPPPLKTRRKKPTELQPKKQVYHSLNTATKIIPSIYTVPTHRTIPIHNATQALRVQQDQCIDESGAYCNDPRYQPLSPMTTDYLSLYSSADREQENNDTELDY